MYEVILVIFIFKQEQLYPIKRVRKMGTGGGEYCRQICRMYLDTTGGGKLIHK